MTIDLVDELVRHVRAGSSSAPLGTGNLLTLPWTMGDGEAVAVFVERIGDDLFHLTDRGLAADSLALADVDLSRAGAAASFRAIQNSIGVAPSLMVDTSPWELAGSAARSELGSVLARLSEAVIRADALRVLGRVRRPISLPDRVIRRAAEFDLGVVPKATLDMRQGGRRQVTCRVEGRTGSRLYVQTLATESGGEFRSYDHVRSVFGDADAPAGALVTVVADSTHLDDWQTRSLESLSRVVVESSQDEMWRALAGAQSPHALRGS